MHKSILFSMIIILLCMSCGCTQSSALSAGTHVQDQGTFEIVNSNQEQDVHNIVSHSDLFSRTTEIVLTPDAAAIWNEERSLAEETTQEGIAITGQFQENTISMVFDESTHNLIRFTYNGDYNNLQAPNIPDSDAIDSLNAAAYWYHTLPVPQTYSKITQQLQGDGNWLYSFQNVISIDDWNIVNPYEEVRVRIEASSGALLGVYAFYYPCSNIKETEPALTKEQAIEVAKSEIVGTDWNVDAKISVCLATPVQSATSISSKQTAALVWEVTLHKIEQNGVESQESIFLDYYTGDILNTISYDDP